MALETTTILRSALYQLYIAKSLEEARNAIEAMCQEEDIAVMQKKAERYRELNTPKEK